MDFTEREWKEIKELDKLLENAKKTIEEANQIVEEINKYKNKEVER